MKHRITDKESNRKNDKEKVDNIAQQSFLWEDGILGKTVRVKDVQKTKTNVICFL